MSMNVIMVNMCLNFVMIVTISFPNYTIVIIVTILPTDTSCHPLNPHQFHLNQSCLPLIHHHLPLNLLHCVENRNLLHSDTSSLSPKFVKVQQWSCGYAFSTFLKPPTSSSKLPPSPFVTPSSSSLQPPTSSSASSPFSPQLSTHSSKPLQASLFRARPSLSKPHPLSPKPPTSSSRPSPSSPNRTPFSSGPPLSSAKLPPVFKTFLSPASSNEINEKGKKNYVWVEKGSLPIFTIPGDIKDLIKNDFVPKVLNQPVSPTTYKDYFAVLLYAEEFYFEKWPHFDLETVTLALHEAAIHKNPDKEEKTFVAFEMDSFPENRPFLYRGT
ncbi:uncharacterized protein LOC110758356 [Prunus avium]|uniref:Uncharacterized protein LOC110758356 n=1 Tax=Prunus avium TaxID=42229 RepID=A0A6P5SQA0_PRUAV|nr:uncharacterized protein LOC110758356 [Prunus avium]